MNINGDGHCFDVERVVFRTSIVKAWVFWFSSCVGQWWMIFSHVWFHFGQHLPPSSVRPIWILSPQLRAINPRLLRMVRVSWGISNFSVETFFTYSNEHKKWRKTEENELRDKLGILKNTHVPNTLVELTLNGKCKVFIFFLPKKSLYYYSTSWLRLSNKHNEIRECGWTPVQLFGHIHSRIPSNPICTATNKFPL